MNKYRHRPLLILLVLILNVSCRHIIKLQHDEIKSVHLQRLVTLTLLQTPLPHDKNSLNLLLLNDGQDIEKLRLKEIMDSLFSKKLIKPLLVAGIHAGDRLMEYGVAGYPDYLGRGNKAGAYSSFILDELYPYILKRSALHKFKSVVFAGCSLGGLSAFDIAWDHAELIEKAGIFSGSFWWRDKDDHAPGYSDANNRIMINKVRNSVKHPHAQFWFYAGEKEETGDRNKNGIIDVIDDTKDLIAGISSNNKSTTNEIIFVLDEKGVHNQTYWSKHLAEFLVWAFGK